jgi:hypothetical protein
MNPPIDAKIKQYKIGSKTATGDYYSPTKTADTP